MSITAAEPFIRMSYELAFVYEFACKKTKQFQFRNAKKCLTHASSGLLPVLKVFSKVTACGDLMTSLRVAKKKFCSTVLVHCNSLQSHIPSIQKSNLLKKQEKIFYQ